MIEFYRGNYNHWGIYIGKNHIVHRWGEEDGIGRSIGLRGNITTIFGKRFNKATIMKTEISVVLKCGGKGRVNNYLDQKQKPLPIEIILDKANSAVGEEGYNVLYDNCEHFATHCRYGQSTSRQVQILVGVSLTVAIFITGFLAALAGGLLLHNSQTQEEEKEDD